ncbi:MAG TPA: hypothetical protein VNG12_10855 [Acidimicrobiales bacterium]|nr:hypothetical protein [Acidimicrobiales bacterium]
MHPTLLAALARDRQADLVRREQLRQHLAATSETRTGRTRLRLGLLLVSLGTRLLTKQDRWVDPVLVDRW